MLVLIFHSFFTIQFILHSDFCDLKSIIFMGERNPYCSLWGREEWFQKKVLVYFMYVYIYVYTG